MVLPWLSAVRTRLGQRLDLLLEFIVLRHQLAVLQRTGTRRPCFRPSERLFWVFLSRWWANWQRGLIIVQPATVLRWRRRGFWAIWGSGSCRRSAPFQRQRERASNGETLSDLFGCVLERRQIALDDAFGGQLRFDKTDAETSYRNAGSVANGDA
jgi:hypothetical protein